MLDPETRKFKYSSGGEAVYCDKMTFSPSALANFSGSYRGSGTLWKDLKVDINVPSTIKHYKVTETAEDQGVALGYNEKYVLTDTIELSGTNEDDSEFNFELPITN